MDGDTNSQPSSTGRTHTRCIQRNHRPQLRQRHPSAKSKRPLPRDAAECIGSGELRTKPTATQPGPSNVHHSRRPRQTNRTGFLPTKIHKHKGKRCLSMFLDHSTQPLWQQMQCRPPGMAHLERITRPTQVRRKFRKIHTVYRPPTTQRLSPQIP